MTKYSLPEERRQAIIQHLQEHGKVNTLELCASLDVSIDTVRRDLKSLEQTGKLQRVHGGALPVSSGNFPYKERQQTHRQEKCKLAKKVVSLLKNNQTIFLDAGTTALHIAQQIPENLQATIITPSPAVAVCLGEHPNLSIIMPGGKLNPKTMSMTGAVTLKSIQSIKVDLCLLGVCSIDHEAGLTCSDFEEAAIKQQMIRNSCEVIAVITEDKIGTVSPFFVTGLGHLNQVITNNSVSPQKLLPYHDSGLQITKV